MATANFSLQTKDRKRLIKDRLVRWIVSFGGLSVLASLIFIFVYLAYVTFPLFSDAKVSWSQGIELSIDKPIVYSVVDDHGTRAAFVTSDGEVVEQSLVSGQQTIRQLPISISMLKTVNNDQLLIVDSDQRLALVQPKFKWQSEKGQSDLELELPGRADWMPTHGSVISLVTANSNAHGTAFAMVDSSGLVHLIWQPTSSDALDSSDSIAVQTLSTLAPLDSADEILLTPDAQTVYVRSGNELAVINRGVEHLVVRELVDLTAVNNAKVTGLKLLSGAHSLLVEYDNQQVWQWFDVVKQDARHLTAIRSFNFDAPLTALLPENLTKGFITVLADGSLQSNYTTSERVVFTSSLPSKNPVSVSALSYNNQYALVLSGGMTYLGHIDNPHPEISLSALFGKVWYESYPEPEFVWQTTAASDEFEGKYSLVPIAFGTIKAAMFAMLFAVPIAVLGAIYTAYFMSSSMRKVVKPTIELMEALPTVIIGFLAGLWFAPIVETHLPAVLLLLLTLPTICLLAGVVWYILPRQYTSKLPSGLHPFTLIPVIIVAMYLAMTYSTDMEVLFFNGDARVFLAQHGIDFDQRNALVVGFAMGFAVIPTIFTIAEDAIFSVPKHLSDGSLALGATQWQTLVYVVLLTASPGIFSAVMMGLGRAVGETMIVLMATGNTPILDWNIFEGMRTLSATMAVELPESEVGSSHYRLLFLIALILFSFTFVVNSLAEWVRQRLREKYSAL